MPVGGNTHHRRNTQHIVAKVGTVLKEGCNIYNSAAHIFTATRLPLKHAGPCPLLTAFHFLQCENRDRGTSNKTAALIPGHCNLYRQSTHHVLCGLHIQSSNARQATCSPMFATDRYS
jgi:hypothetical protein